MDWKDFSAAIQKLASARVALIVGLHARSQADIVARGQAVAIIDRALTEVEQARDEWVDSV